MTNIHWLSLFYRIEQNSSVTLFHRMEAATRLLFCFSARCMHVSKTGILEYSWMSEIAWQNSSSLFRKIMTAIQTGSYLKFWTYQGSFGLFFNWMTMSMKHFWLGSALEFSTNLFFCQVCDGACFYTQCRSCASGKVPKSEDVYSPCKVFWV